MQQVNRIGIYIKQIDVAFDNKCNKMLKKYDITHSQFKVLLYLLKTNEGDEIKQNDLEQVFLLTNPTMTGILQRLESKGFIFRNKSEKDGRSNIVLLSDKSVLLKDELVAIANLMESSLTKGLKQSELEAAYVLLNKFLNNLIEQ